MLDLSLPEINRSPQSPVKSCLRLQQEIAQSCLEINCCQLNIERKEEKERQSGLGINGVSRVLQVYSRQSRSSTDCRKHRKSFSPFQNGLEKGTRDASFHCSGEVPSAGLQENLPEALLGKDATPAQVIGEILKEVSFCITGGEPTSRDSKSLDVGCELKVYRRRSRSSTDCRRCRKSSGPSQSGLEGGTRDASLHCSGEVPSAGLRENLPQVLLGDDATSTQVMGSMWKEVSFYITDCEPAFRDTTDGSSSVMQNDNSSNIFPITYANVVACPKNPSANSRLVKDDADLGIIITEQNVSQILDFPAERALMNPYKKKLLILDMNGLLADVVPFVPSGYKVDIMISGKAVFKRPFCDDFLQFCFDRFDVGVWTSRTKRNMDMLIDFLMGDIRHKLLFCWDQSHCTHTGFTAVENKHEPLFLKELRKLRENLEPNLPWEKGKCNEANTLLLDDSPYKALLNPVHIAVFPHTYRYRDLDDTALGPGGDLQVYLEGLAVAEDVQKYVKQNPFGQRAITEANPSWGFYSKVISRCQCPPTCDANSSSFG